MSEQNENNGGRVRLDAVTLEARAKLLPASMQELFIWLGSFLRDACDGNLDILQKKFTDLKVQHDKTTWSKILRGQWNRDAHGKEVSNPCLAEEKFIRAVNTLRKDAKIKEQGGRIPFVKTSVAQLIISYIDVKRTPDRVNKLGVIIGETGSQKNATTDFYCAENNHGMCVSIEAPARPSMSQFMTDVAKAYGCPSYETLSYGKKQAFVLGAVNAKKTIIIHNVQRLYDHRLGANQPIFSFIQKLMEDTGCTVIITITPVFEKEFTGSAFFEQFEGRAGGRRSFLRLPEYPPEEDVRDIAKGFGMIGLNEKTTWPAVKSGADDEKVTVLEYLNRVAHERGRIRRLFEDLQDAKIEAEAAKESLTIEHVKRVRGE